MSIEFRCPNCEKKLRTGDDKAGKTAKCPQCGSAVTVPVTSQIETEFEEFPSFDQDVPQTGFPPTRASRSTVPTEVVCPMCGARNEASAPRCLSCGEELEAAVADMGRAPSLRFGDIWTRAWEKWSTNLGLNVASAAIAGGLYVAVYMAFLAIFMVFGFGLGAAGAPEGAVIGMLVGMAFAYLLMFIVYAYILLGMANLTLRQNREREANLSAMFSSMPKVIASVICTFLAAIGLTIATLPGVAMYMFGFYLLENENMAGIPLAFGGYFVMFLGWGLGWMLFWPVHYMIASQDSGVIRPLIDGVSLAVRFPKLSFLLAVVHMGLLFAGLFTCYIGLLFSMPLSFMLCAVAFERCQLASRVAAKT